MCSVCTVYVLSMLYVFTILSLQKLERMSKQDSVPTGDADIINKAFSSGLPLVPATPDHDRRHVHCCRS